VDLVDAADRPLRGYSKGMAAHYMEPETVRSTGALALGASVPSALMVWWTAGFTVPALLYAIRAFRRRAL